MTTRFWYWLIIGVLLVVLVSGSVSVVRRIARAIAAAEGFYVSGSRAARQHNPGNLRSSPTAIRTDSGFAVFATDAAGWAALENQVAAMFDGRSQFYRPSMTILEMAARYTATEQGAWARNVAEQLGVTTRTRLDAI